MKNKKTKEVEIAEQSEQLEQPGLITMAQQKRYEQCEWCFQFDEDEPQIFAWTGEAPSDEEPQINFTIGNIEGAYISFTTKDNKRSFKIFARELSEEGKQMRSEQLKMLNPKENESNDGN